MGVGLVESTLKEEFDIYDTLLKIMIPQGAKGLYVDLISNRSEEQEVLFARGIKMRVLFTYRCKGKKIIVCKMLKPIADKSCPYGKENISSAPQSFRYIKEV